MLLTIFKNCVSVVSCRSRLIAVIDHTMTNLAFDEQMMQRALELARRGLGFVEPNPPVGAVVVDDHGAIIGEGWHQKFGGPHAEVHALAAAGSRVSGATLYVTLEPCSHFGKTPPCSQAVIQAGIRRVVIGTVDPAKHGSVRGVDELKAAGIEVDVGILGNDARRLIAPFTRLMTTGLPWVHLKWAMTLDGKIATASGSSQWITNSTSRAAVHQLRGRMDAIVTGIGTVLKDDPRLTSRIADGSPQRIATRVVLDSQCRLPLDSQLVRTVGEAAVIVFTTESASVERIEALRSAGVEVLIVETGSDQRLDVNSVMLELGRRRMTNLFVEAGSRILGGLFDQRLVNEVHAFIAPAISGGGDAPSPIGGRGISTMSDALRLEQTTVQVLDGDLYLHGLVPAAASGD